MRDLSTKHPGFDGPAGASAEMNAIARSPAVASALALLQERDSETLRDMVDLTEIPAPPFGEERRGAAMAERLSALGLVEVRRDEVGNVLARIPGPAEGPPLILSAHLDTVFPDGTDVSVRQDGDRLVAPGIADNGRGLAGILAIARCLRATGLTTRTPLLFAATVGEEGIGDLRGVKHLFRSGSALRAAAGFISIDGTGCRRIVHRGLGSRRLRAKIHGPGGHSWADWGRGNPIHALGLALASIARHMPPRDPRTTLSAGRIGGGTSVNAIPAEAWVELDLRSETRAALNTLERRVREMLKSAVGDANRERHQGSQPLRLEVELIGDRPSGRVPADAALIVAASAATSWIGQTPELVTSSTDANVPMSVGVPAITIGAGGESGGTHTTGEWYRNEQGPLGLARALLTVLAAAGTPDPV